MNRRTVLAACGAALPAVALGAGFSGDASGLRIEALRVRVNVEGPVATTELSQTIRNDLPQAREAILDFPLPPRATFSGLSIEVEGKEVLGEVVPRTRAREVYSDVTGIEVLRPKPPVATAAPELAPKPRPRDPALLENTSGRNLRLRVSPVPARGTQTVRVRFVEPTTHDAGSGRFVLPLGSPLHPTLAERFELDASVSGRALSEVRCDGFRDAHVEERLACEAYSVKLGRDRFVLDRDLALSWKAARRDEPSVDVVAARAVEGRGTALLGLTTWLPAGKPPERDVVLVLDSSASMATSAHVIAPLADAWLASLAEGDRFDVVSFHLAAETLHGRLERASDASRARARRFVRGLRPEHGTDPRTALAAVAKIVRATERPRALDVFLVTDATLSESEELVRSLEGPACARAIRIFALELGSNVAGGPLATLARRTGGAAFAGSVDPAGALRELARIAARPVLRAPSVRVEGATLADVHPTTPPPVLRDGETVPLLAHYEHPGAGTLVLTGTLADGRVATYRLPFTLPARGTTPDVERLWAQAAADDLEGALASDGLLPAERGGLEAELERVSVAGGILTRATSLLALEGEAMFEEYGIGRANRDRTTRERLEEAERRAQLERLIEERRPNRADPDVVAVAPERPIWRGPGGLAGGGGRGGGAGEPVFLVLAGAAAWAARRKRAA